MTILFRLSAFLRLFVLFAILTVTAVGQTNIPSPEDVLGFTPGDDRKLASWAQVVDYFQKLDRASDRMIFQEIGKSTMGAPFVYATISSPDNLRNLERYKKINELLADPRKMTGRVPLIVTPVENNTQKRRLSLPGDISAQLIREGKTIVLITHGIHSTEVGSTLSSMLIAHRLASSNEPEIKKILDNTIVLIVPSLNPDGVDIVKNWYDKTLGTPYEGTTPPDLYHKYVGHDNNRDWYAFTQVETQLTVDKMHNVWHPQIVHDVHQQGANGARLFLPPYMAPVEPNVPKQIVEGFTELGNWMATDLRKKGLEGITTNTTYDAWTPARAYSHYHGGVRILSETASARIASPITVKFDDLRGGTGGLDPKKESEKFSPVWKGGEWKLRNITDYMTATAFSLLTHAANNRGKWLSRFYEIGKEAVRPRRNGEVNAYVIPAKHSDGALLDILRRGGVEYEKSSDSFTAGGKKYEKWSVVIPMAQPYGSFAKALLEKQTYPDLLDPVGNPIVPYDVTAHTLPLLFGTEVDEIRSPFKYKSPKGTGSGSGGGSSCGCGHGIDGPSIVALYRSSISNMDEGWTRWIIEKHKQETAFCCSDFKTIVDAQLRGAIEKRVKTIIFPDQSPSQILNGYAKGSMPDELTGGVGKEGVENLKKFVEAGGTLIFLNRASNFAIQQFGLPVKDVTAGVARKAFFIPGSILRTELDTAHPIAKGMPGESIAWFEDSPAFEIQTDPLALTNNFKVIARYPSDPTQVLLSGWALGAEKIAGKAALIEFTIGKGKIILFGFRPQYRGQSLATFPLFFNAISN